MRHAKPALRWILSCATLATTSAMAADWPQWRGVNRDGKATDFQAPATWPKELAAKWKSAVGAGDATPALVGDRIYAFGRQGDEEVVQCLDAATGKSLWQDKYPSVNVTGGAQQHPGPRSSPSVANGKVVTFGVGGVFSCYDAASGKLLWRKESTKEFQPAWPQFYTGMSPLIVDGMAIAHLGGGGKGAVLAVDLNTGEQKWKWEGDGPAYGSAVLMTVGGVRQVVLPTEASIMGLSLSDGKQLWQVSTGGGGGGRGPGGPGEAGAGRGPGGDRGGPGGPGGPGGGGGRRGGGGGPNYNTSTPVIDGNNIILSGRTGARALAVEKQGDAFAAKEVWTNPEAGTAFSSAVVRDGHAYLLSQSNTIFCLDAKTGKTLWSNSLAGGAGAPGAPGGAGGAGGGARGGRGGGGPGGFGSIVDAGSVLMALTPAGQLVVFKPSADSFTEVTRIKVGESQTFAHPIVVDKRIIVKDQESVVAYSLE